LAAILLLGGWKSVAADKLPVEAGLDVQADSYEFNPETGLAVGDGNVQVLYRGMALTADHLDLNTKTNEVQARGNVCFKRGVFTWNGPQIRGNLTSRAFSFDQSWGQNGVWYFRTEQASTLMDGQHVLQNATLTTCSHLLEAGRAPHSSLNARRIVHYPDGGFKAYHVLYKLGRVPIFYLPIVWGNTREDSSSGVRLSVGYQSDWGGYALYDKEFQLGQNANTKMMLHYRTKNGFALGNETQLKTDTSQTKLLVYGMKDNDAPEEGDTEGYNRRFDKEENRYRVHLAHQQQLAADLSLRLNVDSLSDIDMQEDWFEREYRTTPQPSTYAELTYDRPNYQLSLSVRPQLNDFYTVVEKLPELRLGIPLQPLGQSGILYRSETTAAHLKMNWRDFDLERKNAAGTDVLADAEDYSSNRLDSLHVFSRPFTLFDDVNVIPRAALRLTHYSKSSQTKISTDQLSDLFEVDDPDNEDSLIDAVNYDDQGGDKLRVAGELGFEINRKYYRTWTQRSSSRFGVDGLRHVLVPYLNYTYAPKPSEDRDQLYFFDEADRLTQQNFVRVGLKQRWQTRRRRAIYTLATLDTYADFHFQKEDDYGHLGDFGARTQFMPNGNLRFGGMLLADMDTGTVNHASLSASHGDPGRLRSTLSYAYQNDYTSRTVFSMASTLDDFRGQSWLGRRYDESHTVGLGLEFPLGAKTSAQVSYSYDLVENEFARQSYRLLRDLHCWMGSLSFEEEDGDFSMMFLFYLKAFPDGRLSSSI
jgi:lipopolysaccharide assembly outer membrane protein LptD (OstA)